MKTISRLKTLLLGAALLATVSCPLTANAIVVAGRSSSGTAEVTASVPEFIVLHYYSTIALTFTTPDTEALNQGSNSMNVAWDGTTSNGASLAAGNLMTAKLEIDGNKTNVKLDNVWAVRGFSKSGNATVAITLPNSKMVLESSEIGISNAKVTDGTSTDSSITTKLNGITKKGATIGGVQMDLDFSKTSLSGNHTGGQYMITATTI
jgi:hypothetical protein